MGQDFADQAMLIMPQIADSNPGDRKAFGQLGPDRFDTFADALTGFQQLRMIARSHAGARVAAQTGAGSVSITCTGSAACPLTTVKRCWMAALTCQRLAAWRTNSVRSVSCGKKCR